MSSKKRKQIPDFAVNETNFGSRFGVAQSFKTQFGDISTAKIESVLLRDAVRVQHKKITDTEQKRQFAGKMVATFEKARFAKNFWDTDDLNIFVRTIGSLFDSKETDKIYEMFYATPDPKMTKGEKVVALVRAPIVLGLEGAVPWAKVDYDRYGLRAPPQDAKKSHPDPPVDLSLVVSRPVPQRLL